MFGVTKLVSTTSLHKYIQKNGGALVRGGALITQNTVTLEKSVRPSFRPSVCPSGLLSLSRWRGASYAEYSALFNKLNKKLLMAVVQWNLCNWHCVISLEYNSFHFHSMYRCIAAASRNPVRESVPLSIATQSAG